MQVRWVTGRADVRCPVCGRANDQELRAIAAVFWTSDEIKIVACADCGAIVLSAVVPPSQYDADDLNRYIESFASVEAIADMLAKVGAPEGARMLDIGCGYGFGLDVAQVLFGWSAVGADPSRAAERGRAELGLDIRSGTVDDAFAADERFDVVFASEVLEHVPDPRAFLRTIRDRLSPHGVLALTTPDASVVREGSPLPTLYAALSIGAHEFVIDAQGLERLLRDAGYEARVWTDGASLRALAATTAAALERSRTEVAVDLLAVARYCDTRADSAAPGSALALGMATRFVNLSIHGGDFAQAASGVPRMREALRDRYGYDLEDTDAVLEGELPPVYVLAQYGAGLVAWHHDHDPRRACEHLAASAAVAAARRARHGVYVDPETPAFQTQALALRAILLADIDRPAVPAALRALDDAIEQGAGEPSLAVDVREQVAKALSMRGRARRVARAARRRARGALARRREGGRSIASPRSSA
jgi:SAM-dependent methyltransferase